MLKVGDVADGNYVVKDILGQDETIATVYLSEEGHLRWQYHGNGGKLPAEALPLLAAFDDVMADIRATSSGSEKLSHYVRLGKALHAALVDRDTDSGLKRLLKARERCLAKPLQERRRLYLISCLVLFLLSGALLGLATWKTSDSLARELLFGLLGGTAGAALSVMHRSGDLEVSPTIDLKSVILQATVRLLIGSWFGLFLVLAVKANLVLGAFSDQQLALVVFAILAGFSERLIPDLMKKIEAQV